MFYVSSKRGNKYGITDTKDGVEEFFTEAQVIEINKTIKIYGVSYRGISIVSYTFTTFKDLANHFIRYMTRYGANMGYSDDRKIEEFNGQPCLSIRFIMGMGAWYCSFETDDEDGYCEDICDADTLKRAESKKLRDLCMSFYKDTGIYPSWQTGEKAWCYFEFM